MEFTGALRFPHEEVPRPLSVEIRLDEETILLTAGERVIGVWSLHELPLRATDEGFRLRIEGEDVLLTTTDDAGFALAIGLKSAPPRLRRLMGAALRDGQRAQLRRDQPQSGGPLQV
jgi:hypothetical protein